MTPTVCLDTYWRFAAERQATYLRRLASAEGPWTDDPILREYRFTNPYRAADRVSQYLIRDVQYAAHRSQDPVDVFFRTMLFKLFNNVTTWQLLELGLGPIEFHGFDWDGAATILDGIFAGKTPVYSAAYIMPDIPSYGGGRKHANHLRLLYKMVADELPSRMQQARGLKQVYDLLHAYSGLGPFLAFQYTIDLNYSSLLDHDEASFVVCGPGALDGISKCFTDISGRKPEDVVMLITQYQDYEFARLGIDFPGLFGRRLQPIDCQNLFCEISKYARVAHPDIKGKAGRERIKQKYGRARGEPMPIPFFPPKWGINDAIAVN